MLNSLLFTACIYREIQENCKVGTFFPVEREPGSLHTTRNRLNTPCQYVSAEVLGKTDEGFRYVQIFSYYIIYYVVY